MDTTFWGPSGHQLFHLLTFAFDRRPEEEQRTLARSFRKWMKSVGHILPCIYCRRSFQQYYRELPLAAFLPSHSFEWYYLIHNRINQKLRGQGYLHSRDPSLRKVRETYSRRFEHRGCFVGWDFLYSVLYHFPSHWSELSQRRLEAYATFFNGLGLFYPVASIREQYNEYLAAHPIEKSLVSFETLTKWLYAFEKRIHPECCGYRAKCRRLDRYKVKKCAGKSCRRSPRVSPSTKQTRHTS